MFRKLLEFCRAWGTAFCNNFLKAWCFSFAGKGVCAALKEQSEKLRKLIGAQNPELLKKIDNAVSNMKGASGVFGSHAYTKEMMNTMNYFNFIPNV